VVQNADDDVNRALAAFSAPAISYRNFTFRPLASGEPKQTNPPIGGFRLLSAAIPEAAWVAPGPNHRLPASAPAKAEAVPEQALSTGTPHADAGRANAPARDLPAARTNPGTGASEQRPPPGHAPDSNGKPPLAAVFSALKADRLPAENLAEAEQELRTIFSML
jgi:hypothetical protein